MPGVGLVEVLDSIGPDGLPEVITLEPLSPLQLGRLRLWLEHEWPTRNERWGFST